MGANRAAVFSAIVSTIRSNEGPITIANPRESKSESLLHLRKQNLSLETGFWGGTGKLTLPAIMMTALRSVTGSKMPS